MYLFSSLNRSLCYISHSNFSFSNVVVCYISVIEEKVIETKKLFFCYSVKACTSLFLLILQGEKWMKSVQTGTKKKKFRRKQQRQKKNRVSCFPANGSAKKKLICQSYKCMDGGIFFHHSMTTTKIMSPHIHEVGRFCTDIAKKEKR